MRVIIAGCGRVGAELATSLSVTGHEVAIVDKDPLSFRRLGASFAGRTVLGIVFDRRTLEEAGVTRAGALVAVTNGDNSNIVAARAAREAYGVDQVVARIYDPVRARIYERLGVTTIASARWTAETILGVLLPSGERTEASLGPGAGEVVVVTQRIPDGVHALDAARLSKPGEFVLAAVTREGATRVPQAGALLEAGDELHLAVRRDRLEQLQAWIRGLATQELAR